MAHWYYLHNGNQVGPVGDEDLVTFVQNGEIKLDDLVWCEDLPEWVPASEVVEIESPGEAKAQPAIWFYLVDNQQQGPVAFDQLAGFVATGQLNPETLVWSEGLDDWVEANRLEGIDAPGSAPASAPAPSPAPAVPMAVPLEQSAPAGTAGKPKTIRTGGKKPKTLVRKSSVRKSNARKPVSSASPGPAPAAAQPAPPQGRPVKRTSSKLAVGLLAGGFGCMLLGFALSFGAWMSGEAALGLAGMLVCVCSYAVLFGGIVMFYIALYRAWSVLPPGHGRTTPGKAVGFMFIPLFNLYWIFVALPGLADDWNRYVSQHAPGAPTMKHGLFLALPIMCFIPCVSLFAIFLLIPTVSQLCRGINHFARAS